MSFDTKLTPNYIIGGATAATLLYAVIAILQDPAKYISQVVEVAEAVDGPTGLVVGGIGGGIITAFIVSQEKVFNYFFKKNPSKP